MQTIWPMELYLSTKTHDYDSGAINWNLFFYYYYIPRLSDCLMPRDRTEAQTGGGGWESYFTISVLSFTDDAHQILSKLTC